MKFKLILLSLIGLLFLNSVNAYSIEGGGVCDCSNCSDCTNALNDNVNCYTTIDLQSDIEIASGNCINAPVNFSNKDFNCNNHIINITGDGKGIYLFRSAPAVQFSNIDIENCRVYVAGTGATVYGIYVYNGSNVDIVNNTVQCRHAFQFAYIINLLVEYNNVVGAGDGRGMTFSALAGATVQYNVFNETEDNITKGIQLINTDSSDFLWNEIYFNKDNNDERGVEFTGAGSQDNDFNYNTILDSGQYGIYWDNELSGNNRFYDNIICDSITYDIYNQNVSNTGDENTCDSYYNWQDYSSGLGCLYVCGEQSCYCWSCDECEEKLNDTNCNRVFLMDDITNYNGSICINGYGLSNWQHKYFYGEDHIIDGIYDEGNISYGMYLDNNNDNYVIGFYISDFGMGIKTVNTDETVFQDINITHSSNKGFEIYNSDYIRMRDSYIYNNEGDGISIFNSGFAFEGSEVKNNSGYGIYWYSGITNYIKMNKILDNEGGIFLGSGVSGITIRDNIICRNAYLEQNRYDIRDDGSNTGDSNTCDYCFSWNDDGETCCSFECLGAYQEVNISEEMQQYQNITDAFQSVDNIIEDMGFKSAEAKVLFCFIFKIILDLILASQKLNWKAIIIINIIVVILFVIMGWIPFLPYGLILILISAFIFGHFMKETVD